MVIIIQIHPQTALSQVNSGNRTSVKALSTVRIERLGYTVVTQLCQDTIALVE